MTEKGEAVHRIILERFEKQKGFFLHLMVETVSWNDLLIQIALRKSRIGSDHCKSAAVPSVSVNEETVGRALTDDGGENPVRMPGSIDADHTVISEKIESSPDRSKNRSAVVDPLDAVGIGDPALPILSPLIDHAA